MSIGADVGELPVVVCDRQDEITTIRLAQVVPAGRRPEDPQTVRAAVSLDALPQTWSIISSPSWAHNPPARLIGINDAALQVAICLVGGFTFSGVNVR